MNATLSTKLRKTSIALAMAAAPLVFGSLAACGPTSNTSAKASTSSGSVVMDASAPDSKQIGLYTTMRTLWAQHMEWTYDAVVAFASNSPGLNDTLNRLLQNQTDIGNAVALFYGDAAGTQLTALLKTHINDAVPVLQAAKAGDMAALNTAVNNWYANAKQIGDFLASANPHWAQGPMEDMMKEHITQTIAYATDILQGHWTAAITDFGTAEQHMVDMSDMLSQGIIAQFPDKF